MNVVIKKDPEELPENVVGFHDVYDDINSPQYWIAQAEEDLHPSLLVLDGHSTILSYKQETEELHWEAIHELGQYRYQPDQVGDGLIVFPHTFYVEFQISLTDKILDVNANFDGTGIRAVAMPLKEVGIEDFMDVFTTRISTTFSSVLKPNDDRLDITEGEVMTIPESVMSKLSLKLALMGINVQKVKVDKVTEIELEEDEIQEGVFEVPTEEPKEEKKKIAPKKETKPAEPEMEREEAEVPPPSSAPSGAPPAAPPEAPSSDRSIPSSPPGPSSPAPKPTSGGPPKPGQKPARSASAGATGGAVDIDAETKSPSSIPPPPAAKSSGPPSPTSRKRSAAQSPAPPPSSSPEPEEEVEMDDMMVEERSEEVTNLYAKGMDTTSKTSLRHTHTTWFDRMIPNRAYPLVVKISGEEMKRRKSVTSQTTGERRSENVDQMMVDEGETLTVRPEFPGCIVVPPEQKVDVSEKQVTARFHVTPLALGRLDSKIVFEQQGREVHRMELETKVIKHRISRWSAALGAVTGSLPAVMAFFLNETPSEFMNDRLSDISILSGLGYGLPIILAAVFFGVAGVFSFLQKPSKTDKSVSFPR